MAFPASQQRLASALEQIAISANRIKQSTQAIRDASASGPIERMRVVNFQRQLSDTIEKWDQASSVPGLGQYAQEQYSNAGLDITSEYSAMRSAAVALRDWIQANMPKDSVSGAALLQSLNADGSFSELTFSSAETASFRTNADTLIATIG